MPPRQGDGVSHAATDVSVQFCACFVPGFGGTAALDSENAGTESALGPIWPPNFEKGTDFGKIVDPNFGPAE